MIKYGQYMRVLYTPPSGSPALELARYNSQSTAPCLRVDVSIVRHLRPAGQREGGSGVDTVAWASCTRITWGQP